MQAATRGAPPRHRRFARRTTPRDAARRAATFGIRPDSWFPTRLNCRRRPRFPSHAGTGPVKPFRPRESDSSLARSPNAGGSGPMRPLSTRSSPVTRPVASVVTPCQSPSGADVFQLSRSAQSGPPVESWNATSAARSCATPQSMRPFASARRANSDSRGKSGARQSPVSLSRDSQMRLPRLPRWPGIGPLNPFCASQRPSSLDRFPKLPGIEPLNPLSFSVRYTRLDRFPRLLGSGPLSPLPSSSRIATRPSASVTTPNHSSRGAAVAQFVLSTQFACSERNAIRSAAPPRAPSGGDPRMRDG